MREQIVPLRERLDQHTQDVGEVSRHDEPRERNLPAQCLSKMRNAKVPDKHQFTVIASTQLSERLAARCVLQVIGAPRGTEVASGLVGFNGFATLDGRLDALRRDLEARIRPLVPDLSDEEFHALIERMAQLQFKYEARRAEDFFDRSARDQAAEDDAKSEI